MTYTDQPHTIAELLRRELKHAEEREVLLNEAIKATEGRLADMRYDRVKNGALIEELRQHVPTKITREPNADGD